MDQTKQCLFDDQQLIDLEVPIDPGAPYGGFCRHMFSETPFNSL